MTERVPVTGGAGFIGSHLVDELFQRGHEPAQHLFRTVTILLPALNEEAAIGRVLDELPIETMRSMGYVPRVVVVDGHSTDATVAVARSHGVDVLPQMGTGKGWAVRTGLQKIRSDHVIMLDADFTYPAIKIPALLRQLEGGADIVVGSRFRGLMDEGAMRPINVLGNRFLSFLASALYGQRITDVCSGMWAFGPRAIAALDLNSEGFEVEAEIFAQAVKSGLRMEEIPIPYRRRIGQEKLRSVSDGVHIASNLIRRRFVR